MRRCRFTVFVPTIGKQTSEPWTKENRQGEFHQFTRGVNRDGKVVPQAIVSDDDGQVHMVPPHVVTFNVVPTPEALADLTPEQELVAAVKRIEGRINGAIHFFENTCADIVAIESRR